MSGFKKKFNFLEIFSKNFLISNIMKIRLVGAELLDADSLGMDRYDEANGRLSQFYERF